MTPQLFDYRNYNVRIVKDEAGNPWFAAKDECDILGIVWNGKNTLSAIKPEWQRVWKLHTQKGLQSVIFINEAAVYKLAFRSNKPEAEAFTDWVASEVLPSIRKTGSYSLRNLILPEPTTWERTFPDEFMRQAMKLHGLPYDPSRGTPQFMGHFINKYVYSILDKEATKELKLARQQWGNGDNMAFLHQFLNAEGRNVLREHLITVVALMKISSEIKQFDIQFFKVFRAPNQLELYLRIR